MNFEKIYQRINDFIGNDYKKLSTCTKLFDELNKEKEEIESKLSNISVEIPSKIIKTTARINEVELTIQCFIKEIDTFLEIYNTGELENSFEKLSDFASKKKEYSKCLNYLNTLKFIEVISSDIKKNYFDNNWPQCVTLYSTLCSLLHCVSNSRCMNLLKYLKDVIHYWHQLLKSRLISDYEQLLKIMNWPFVIRNKSLPSYPSDDLKPKFQLLTKLLLEVELPEEMREKLVITSTSVVDFPIPSLPILLLLEPLRKRFLFHFCGNKQTNRSDKPEWMFSQILTWIKDHELFITNWLQPVCKGSTVSAKVEFIRGLIKTVIEKLHTDLLKLQYDDSLFTHMLDETLGFHRELTVNYGYPTSCGSVLSVLTQAQIFIKWLNTEQKSAEKRMDDMLNSNTAWITITEDEKCKITECGDKFVILLTAITDRYSALPQPGHRLQFLDFQLDLIDEFRLRLAQLKRDDYFDILNSDLPAILNTVHYLSTVLTEWGTSTHFLMLHHFKYQINSNEDRNKISVFSDILALIHHFSDELVKEICTSVCLEISAKSRSYRKDRWNIMPPMDPETDLGLTLSGCTMFQVLTNKLYQMRNVIAPEIFKNCWKYVADHLCKLIIDDVILVNMFSKGGAQQIQFDIKRNILPLFAQFTTKPEAYFKSLIEACDLLCSESIVNVDSIPFPITALNKYQVETILNRRSGKFMFSELT